RVVRQFRDQAALPVLAEALQDPHEIVWKDALDGLVTLGGLEALEILRDIRTNLGNDLSVERHAWISEAIAQIQEELPFGGPPPWKRPYQRPRPSESVTELMRRQWRELGLYYERDDSARVWKLTGSLAGLHRFREALLAYATDSYRATASDHEHFGPYFYLKVMTWREAGIDEDALRGSLPDLQRLADLIGRTLDGATPGSTFLIQDEFAPSCPYALALHVREEEFDPADADPSLRTDEPSRKRDGG